MNVLAAHLQPQDYTNLWHCSPRLLFSSSFNFCKKKILNNCWFPSHNLLTDDISALENLRSGGFHKAIIESSKIDHITLLVQSYDVLHIHKLPIIICKLKISLIVLYFCPLFFKLPYNFFIIYSVN